MGTRNWEQRNADIAPYETNRQLESQRLELYQANQWADQAQREQICLFEELDIGMGNRIFQEDHAKDCQEIEELRRICCEEAEQARQIRIDELSLQQERNPSNVSQLLTQIQDLQEKVNSLADAKDFYDPETASSSGVSIPSPRGMISRDSCLPHDTRNSIGTSGNVFKCLPARDGPSSSIFENSRKLASSSCGLTSGNIMEHGRGVRRDPQSSSIPTPRFNQGPRGFRSRKCILGNSWTHWNFKAGKSTSRLMYVQNQQTLNSQCNGSKKLR